MARILGGPPFSNQHGRTYQHPASWPSDTSGKIWNRGHARRHRCLARVRQMRQRVPASHARVPASRGRRLRRLLPVRRLRRTERHRCAAAGTLTQGGPAAHTLSTGVTRLRRTTFRTCRCRCRTTGRSAAPAAATAPRSRPASPIWHRKRCAAAPVATGSNSSRRPSSIIPCHERLASPCTRGTRGPISITRIIDDARFGG